MRDDQFGETGWRGSWADISEQAKDEFLQHVANGDERKVAARKVGHTGTEFRALTKRDEAFREQYQEALEGRQDEIRERWWERSKESDRLLLEQADTYLPERAYRRNRSVSVGGPDGGPVEIIVRSMFEPDSDTGSAGDSNGQAERPGEGVEGS